MSSGTHKIPPPISSDAEADDSRFVEPGCPPTVLEETTIDPGRGAERLSERFLALLRSLKRRSGDESRYTNKGEIARGGMGTIFRVHDEGLDRELAMKVALPGGEEDATIDDTMALARFLEEAQITGQLDHPGIVPVHEMGIDARGRVFFTMQLVKGQNLSAVLSRLRSGDPACGQTRVLHMILRACEAMAYAHTKGVIHRDLKPANIMVGRFGQVYVMDWGVAKIQGRSDTRDLRLRVSDDTPGPAVRTYRGLELEETPDSPLMTMDGSVVGTPSYMPPEQARGEMERIGPRSDVYAMGAILYELVSGCMPYTRPDTTVDARGILMLLLQAAPPPVADLNPAAPPELRAICEKAMARRPENRYADMVELADDLRAYLEGRVVQAFQSGPFAELGKWISRNKALSLAGAATLAVILFASAFVAYQASRNESRVTAERNVALENARQAETARDELERVVDYQMRMLKSLQPQSLGESLLETFAVAIGSRMTENGRSAVEIAEAIETFRALAREANPTNVAQALLDDQILSRAAERIGRDFSEQPKTAASLRQTVADLYSQIGLFDQACVNQREALELRRQALGNEDEKTVNSIRSMGSLLAKQGRLNEAEPYLSEALETSRRALGDAHATTLSSAHGLGMLRFRQGRLAEAEPLVREALEGKRRTLGDDHVSTLISMNDLSLVLRAADDLAEAERYARLALEGQRRVLGETHSNTLTSLHNVAHILRQQGRAIEAEEYIRESLETSRRVLGDEHPDTLVSISDMGSLLVSLGRLDEAEPYVREAMEGFRRTLGDGHPVTLSSIHGMGGLLLTRGSYDEAAACWSEVIAGFRKSLGDQHPDTLQCIENMGTLLFRQGRLEEAEPFIREALEGKRGTLGNDHQYTRRSIYGLAILMSRMGRFDEAVALAEELLELAAGDSAEQAKYQALLDDVRESEGRMP